MLQCPDPVALLPHRPPFRFVDSVDDLVPGRSVVARYRVTGDEACLAGHFPGNPIFPGVLQLEALAQAGAIALLSLERFANSLPLFGGVDSVRFRRQVVPGDTLDLRVEMRQLASRAGRALGEVFVDGTRTCSAQLMFVLADSPSIANAADVAQALAPDAAPAAH